MTMPRNKRASNQGRSKGPRQGACRTYPGRRPFRGAAQGTASANEVWRFPLKQRLDARASISSCRPVVITTIRTNVSYAKPGRFALPTSTILGQRAFTIYQSFCAILEKPSGGEPDGLTSIGEIYATQEEGGPGGCND